MRITVLLGCLCFAFASCFGQSGYLKFRLDKQLHIIWAGNENMEFLVPQDEFIGKVITQAVPLSEEDQVLLQHGFACVAQDRMSREVRYTLQGVQFLAEIEYTIDGFLVTVQELAK